MPLRDNDEALPYRSPVTVRAAPAAVTKDEADYETLKMVHKLFTETVESLYKEFNAFTFPTDMLPEDRAKVLLHQVEVNQGVYDIVEPLLERVTNAIAKVDSTFIRRTK